MRAGGRSGAGAARMAALAALALAVPAAAGAVGGEPAAKVYDWGVAYYMPYDNDLEGAGERIIKAIRLEKDRGLLIVAQARGGMMEAWTMVPTSDFRYLNAQRRGRLAWSR